jgi:hypothetical protein
MIENPYLECHVYAHYIERADGERVELIDERKEKLFLTAEGRGKRRELCAVLYSGVPGELAAHVLVAGSIVLAVGLAILAAMFIPASFPTIDWSVAFVAGAFLGGVIALAIITFVSWRARKQMYQNVVLVAQFIAHNPQFMAALEAMHDETRRVALKLVSRYEEQSVA